MITVEEIRKEVESLTEMLKSVKTMEDCRNLRRYGYEEEFTYVVIDGEHWNLKDAMFEMQDWETIEVQAVRVSDCEVDSGVSSIGIDEDGKVTFTVVDNDYDIEYDMLEDCTLDTLEKEYENAVSVGRNGLI